MKHSRNSFYFVLGMLGTVVSLLLWRAASVGMLFSNLTMSRYMAYASPFVIYYVLIILYERYFPVVYVLYPKEWLAPSSLWLYGNAGVLMIVAELTALAGLGAGLSAGRRLSNV